MTVPIRFLCSLLALASLHSGMAIDKDRPNILWITSEDNGVSWVSCYGGTNAQTPAIDQLAKEGFRYLHCFDNAAVCAPTRSCWITGMYGISNGTQPMRSRNAIPHDKSKYYPYLLRARVYHTSNPTKTDYNIGGRPDKDCWDYKGGKGKTPYGWRLRKDGKPFFAVVNIGDSHESRAHGKVNKTANDPAKMKLFSYHPDLPTIRQNYAKYADAIENMDRKVGDTIKAPRGRQRELDDLERRRLRRAPRARGGRRGERPQGGRPVRHQAPGHVRRPDAGGRGRDQGD